MFTSHFACALPGPSTEDPGARASTSNSLECVMCALNTLGFYDVMIAHLTEAFCADLVNFMFVDQVTTRLFRWIKDTTDEQF